MDEEEVDEEEVDEEEVDEEEVDEEEVDEEEDVDEEKVEEEFEGKVGGENSAQHNITGEIIRSSGHSTQIIQSQVANEAPIRE